MDDKLYGDNLNQKQFANQNVVSEDVALRPNNQQLLPQQDDSKSDSDVSQDSSIDSRDQQPNKQGTVTIKKQTIKQIAQIKRAQAAYHKKGQLFVLIDSNKE